jgi:hypothetical protein
MSPKLDIAYAPKARRSRAPGVSLLLLALFAGWVALQVGVLIFEEEQAQLREYQDYPDISGLTRISLWISHSWAGELSRAVLLLIGSLAGMAAGITPHLRPSRVLMYAALGITLLLIMSNAMACFQLITEGSIRIGPSRYLTMVLGSDELVNVLYPGIPLVLTLLAWRGKHNHKA